MRLDGSPFSLEKLVKKWFKHLVWIGFSLWTGYTFVGYFNPIGELGLEFFQNRMGSWEIFWVLFYGFATYGNAGWMREQVCKYMCPYARFQSAMFDKDTLIVSYDAARGEPRGTRGRKDDLQAKGLGACIDCDKCVAVCPQGIDIRDGFQLECIACTKCVDACTSVMTKFNQPSLVRYSTVELDRGGAHRWVRPRVVLYSALIVGVTSVFGWLMMGRRGPVGRSVSPAVPCARGAAAPAAAGLLGLTFLRLASQSSSPLSQVEDRRLQRVGPVGAR
jgi:cytochrome c oxidase accessory protein FixG